MSQEVVSSSQAPALSIPCTDSAGPHAERLEKLFPAEPASITREDGLVLYRDMVLGRIVDEGTSTLDGNVVDTNLAQRLLSGFGIGANSFSVVLIGKDGGEKLRVNDIPDLHAIYAVIDGMPMRGSEMSANPGRC
jgi:hypothetical protein